MMYSYVQATEEVFPAMLAFLEKWDSSSPLPPPPASKTVESPTAMLQQAMQRF